VRLRWTERARRDLLEIGRFIARDKPGAARRWVARIEVRARQAAESPRAGRKVPELGREDLRELIERNYRIIYRIVGEEIHVLMVFESHRLLRVTEVSEDE
jgi:plasmid stabilization system protein ParE